MEKAKTQAGCRTLEVPDLLWPHLEQRIRGRAPTDALFPSTSSDDGFHWRDWVRKNAERLCFTAGGSFPGSTVW